MKPLWQVASGGELSRIMLAMKSCLAEVDRIETLIFDEIDVGISGRTAQMVAEKIYAIAKKSSGNLYYASSADCSYGITALLN